MRKKKRIRVYLRSRSVGTALSRLLALFSDISSCGASAGTAASVTWTGSQILAFDVFHGFVVVIIAIHVLDRLNLPRLEVLALQDAVHGLANTAVAGAKMAGVGAATLGFRLHPEEVAL